MQVYVVAYDLHKADSDDYENVWNTIQEICSNAWVHLEESVYLICSDLKAKEILDKLEPHLTKGSKLLVSPIDTGSAWSPGSDALNEWFKKARARTKH